MAHVAHFPKSCLHENLGLGLLGICAICATLYPPPPQKKLLFAASSLIVMAMPLSKKMRHTLEEPSFFPVPIILHRFLRR